jgi:type IV pilus assembly protein PilY1
LTTLTPRTVARDANGDLVATAGVTIDYLSTDAAAARDGWYFNLPGTSEMVVSNIGFRANSVFFTSIRPPGSTGTSCSAQPDSSLYLFDPVAGTATRSVLGSIEVSSVLTPILGKAVSDQKVRDAVDATSETTTTTPGSTPCTGSNCPVTCPDGGAATRFVGQTTDLTTCTPQTNARRQWREIPGLRTLN